MTLVAATLYCAGKRVRDVSLDEDVAFGDDRSSFIWIGLFEPSEEELEAVAARYKLHPLAVEDALTAHQMPKVDVYGEQMFVVARTARLEGVEIEYGETGIFVGPNHIISVRHGSARAHTELRKQIEASPLMLAHGVDYILHAILDFVVDGYFPIVEAIEEEVLDIEQATLDARLDQGSILRLFGLRKTLVRFQRILGPMVEVATKFERLDMPCIDAETRPYFTDVADHVRRVRASVDGLRESLSTVFEVSSLFEQQRQGAITRQLAAWAAILAVLTTIAGVYGMNFDFMPELRWHYGYFIVLGGMFAVSVGLYVRFKRAGWL